MMGKEGMLAHDVSLVSRTAKRIVMASLASTAILIMTGACTMSGPDIARQFPQRRQALDELADAIQGASHLQNLCFYDHGEAVINRQTLGPGSSNDLQRIRDGLKHQGVTLDNVEHVKDLMRASGVYCVYNAPDFVQMEAHGGVLDLRLGYARFAGAMTGKDPVVIFRKHFSHADLVYHDLRLGLLSGSWYWYDFTD